MFNAMAGVQVWGLTLGEKGQDLTGFSHVNVMRVAAKASNTVRGIPAPTEEELKRRSRPKYARRRPQSRRPSRQLPGLDLGRATVFYDEAFERLLGEEKFPTSGRR